MNLPRLRRRPGNRTLAACSLALLVPALGACGFNAQTDQVYQAAAGTNSRIDFANSTDHVDILNSIVVAKKEGLGTWAGSLVNISPKKSDQLVSVSSGTLTSGPVTIKADDLVNFGKTGELTIKSPQVQPGAFVTLTFTFSSGQTTKLQTPVVPYSPSGDYSAVPMPSSGATNKPAKSPKGQPSSTSSPSATGTASPAS